MRPSPIQLLEAKLLRVDIEPVHDKRAEAAVTSPFIFNNIVIQTSRSFEKAKEYWEDTAPPTVGLEDRTYAITLGKNPCRGPAGRPVSLRDCIWRSGRHCSNKRPSRHDY